MDEPRLKLPPKVTRQVLEKHKRPGEPEVLMVAKGIGSTQPFELCDREGRSYTLLWDVKLDGHVLRFPWHVWMGQNAKVALGLMEQRRMTFPLVILVEWTRTVEAVVEESLKAEEAEEPAAGDVSRWELALDILAEGAVRTKILATRLDVTDAALREWLAEADCPAELIHGGWVRMKQ